MKSQEILKEIRSLSKKDKRRFIQCLLCNNDAETCGRDEKDEDENGYCLYYESLTKGVIK